MVCTSMCTAMCTAVCTTVCYGRGAVFLFCYEEPSSLNTFTAGNPFPETKLLGISIGRGFGALKGWVLGLLQV